MIDLSYKKRTVQDSEQEEPLGIAVLGLMPFAWFFAWMLMQGLLHG